MDHDHHDSDADGRDRGTLQTRRSFLRTSVLGAAASWTLPAFIDKTFAAMNTQAENHGGLQIVTGTDGPILVVLQQAGGNDGLNMLPPWADDAYHRARPTLGIAADKALRLNDYCGLHPSLSALKGLYDDGHMAVVQGVGYPNPNRSHFRSTEIWQTATDSDRSRPTAGWAVISIAAARARRRPSAWPSAGRCRRRSPRRIRRASLSPTRNSIAGSTRNTIKATLPPPRPSIISVRSTRPARSTRRPAAAWKICPAAPSGPSPRAAGRIRAKWVRSTFLERTALDAQLSSDKVLEIARKTRPQASYPNSKLADSLSLVARMIAGGLPTRVYYVSHGGYDTHQNQANTHERLMKELGDALGAFCTDLKTQGNLGRVMVMTFSEFGRRVSQNASGGTDHGAAAPMFLFGGGVRPGLYGQYPSLTDLYQGDIKYNVDFRSVYATALERWLKVSSTGVLGRKFPLLPVV